MDCGEARKVTVQAPQPTLRSFEIRAAESMIAELKVVANCRDVPSQALLKVRLRERIEKRLRPRHGANYDDQAKPHRAGYPNWPASFRRSSRLPARTRPSVPASEAADLMARRGLTGTVLQVWPFDETQARELAQLRAKLRRSGLGLADLACLALAGCLKLPVATAHRLWADLHTGIEANCIRQGPGSPTVQRFTTGQREQEGSPRTASVRILGRRRTGLRAEG